MHWFLSYLVEPVMELLLAPSAESGQQMLLCTGQGFDPQIKWSSESRQIRESKSDISMDANGRVTVISQLKVSEAEWKTGKVYNCVFLLKGHKIDSTLFLVHYHPGPAVTDPVVEIRRSFPDFLKGDSAVLVCDVTELSSTDLFVTFMANGVEISPKQYVDLPEAPGPYSISRSFPVPSDHWKKDKSFTCKVTQGFSRTFPSVSTVNIFVEPVMELLLAPSAESEQQMLLCTGQGFDPQIKWSSESRQIRESKSDISMDANGRVTVISQLKVSEAEWKTGKDQEATYSCVVSHESSDKPLESTTKDVFAKKKKHVAVCVDAPGNPIIFLI
uniref:Ig-like domain-containing protein n=1 Tax=Sphaeramia orbicularis TaxID=375764 RepID=A0A672YJ74_9TELE